MARRYSKPIDLYDAQIKRFAQMEKRADIMHGAIANQGKADAHELTGGGPTGKARIRQLRRLGHPFGRGASAAESTPTGMRRGVSTALQKKHGRGQLPNLPIAVVGGQLRRSIRLRKIAQGRGIQRFDVGFSSSAKGSAWVVSPSGTRKMVARGYWTEVKRRWRARNKALIDVLKHEQGN